jgi:hypothetical protein
MNFSVLCGLHKPSFLGVAGVTVLRPLYSGEVGCYSTAAPAHYPGGPGSFFN